MNTQTEQTDKNIQRVIESSAVLVAIGTGLNIIVMQTLGSFDAAAVILGLLIGFWALVLGTVILVLSSSWLFIKRNHAMSESMNGKPAEAHAPTGLHAVSHRRMCTMH